MLFLKRKIFWRSKKHHFFRWSAMGGYTGPPLKNTGLGRLHQSTPRIRRISEKSAEIPPGGWALRVHGPNTPSGEPLRWPTEGGVPFSLLACILWETSLAHRFHRKSPKSPKSAQKGGTPLCDHFFRELPAIWAPCCRFSPKSAEIPHGGPS